MGKGFFFDKYLKNAFGENQKPPKDAKQARAKQIEEASDRIMQRMETLNIAAGDALDQVPPVNWDQAEETVREVAARQEHAAMHDWQSQGCPTNADVKVAKPLRLKKPAAA